MLHLNDKAPNYQGLSGQLFLRQCFNCGWTAGGPVEAKSTCPGCSWTEGQALDFTSSQMTVFEFCCAGILKAYVDDGLGFGFKEGVREKAYDLLNGAYWFL